MHKQKWETYMKKNLTEEQKDIIKAWFLSHKASSKAPRDLRDHLRSILDNYSRNEDWHKLNVIYLNSKYKP